MLPAIGPLSRMVSLASIPGAGFSNPPANPYKPSRTMSYAYIASASMPVKQKRLQGNTISFVPSIHGDFLAASEARLLRYCGCLPNSCDHIQTEVEKLLALSSVYHCPGVAIFTTEVRS